MSNIFALTEDARRRAEGSCCRCCEAPSPHEMPCERITDGADKETILLLVVLLLLYKAGASTMLLLAILYVTL